jgi:MFS family permease
MVAAAAALRVLGSGLHSYGFTVFFLPLSQDLGLSRTATSLAFSLARAEGAIEGPVVGHLLDRFGPRPVMIAAVLLMGVGYLCLSAVDSYATFLAVYLGIISLAHSGGFMHAPMVVANTWFIRKRTRAITLNSAAFSLGGVLLAPVLNIVVQAWGWRWGAASAGLLFLLVGLPLCSVIRRSPESMGLLPDGDSPRTSDESSDKRPASPSTQEDVTLAQALRSLSFWVLVMGAGIRTFSYNAISSHFIPFMVWKGMSQQQCAFLLGSFALLGLTSVLLFGSLADRVNKPRMMALILIAAGAAMLLPIFGNSFGTLLLFTALFTTVECTYPVGWALVGDFFGRKHFAKIRGYMGLFYVWGGVSGPVVAGAIYDRWQTYEPILWILIALFVVSGIFYARLIKPWDTIRGNRSL